MTEEDIKQLLFRAQEKAMLMNHDHNQKGSDVIVTLLALRSFERALTESVREHEPHKLRQCEAMWDILGPLVSDSCSHIGLTGPN